MENKYVVKIKGTNTFISYNFYSEKLRFLRSFIYAIHFDSVEDVNEFLKNHNILKTDCELYKLKVFIEDVSWD